MSTTVSGRARSRGATRLGPRLAVAASMLALSALLLGGACARSAVPEPERSSEMSPPARERFLPAATFERPWLVEVEARHRAADERLARGDRAGAREALRGALGALEETAPPPAAGAVADAAAGRAALIEDTCYRLARVELEAGEPARALAAVERGLAASPSDARPDLFRANLLVARGAAHEASGHAREAAADYHAALLINEALLAGSPEAP